MKIKQVSINFDTVCSYYEEYVGRIAFLVCSLNGDERGEKRAGPAS